MATRNTPEEIDWTKLDEPIDHPNTTSVGDIKVDVIASVPEPIRKRAEECLGINTKRVAAKAGSQGKRPRVDYAWFIQPLASAGMGEQFSKLITKYAKFRPNAIPIPFAADGVMAGQVTARCGNVGYFVKGEDDKYTACDKGTKGAFLGMRYSVRPREQRKDTARVPGTAG